MLWRSRYDPTAYDDDWEGQPAQGTFYKWVLGVAAPIGMCGYGLYAIFTRQIEFGSHVQLTLHGLNAAAGGVAWVSAAVFMHCHYFWGNVYDQIWFAVLGKIAAGIGFILGLGFILIHNGIFGLG